MGCRALNSRLIAGVLTTVLAFLFAAPAALGQEAKTPLEAADEAFRFQDYAKTIELLKPMLDGEQLEDDQAHAEVLVLASPDCVDRSTDLPLSMPLRSPAGCTMVS